MKKKYKLGFLGYLVLLLGSCAEVVDNKPVYGGPGGGRDGGRFYAQDMTNNSFYTLYAEKLWSEEDDPSTRVVVWAEIGSGMIKSDGETVAEEYNKTGGIYEKLMPVFGMEENFTDAFTNSTAIVAENTMEFADYYGNGDNKLCILLLKIKDGFNPPKNDSYVAGYFTAYNFLGYDPGNYDSYYSNECDMIYIDVKENKPSDASKSRLFTTLAHEMQHMMNFVTTLDRRRSGNTFKQMDLWIDEGLSSAAEYVYSGVHTQERINWYNVHPLDQTGRIAYGNNFYVWGNYIKTTPDAILDDYATVYLFFQWLRLQADSGVAIYNDIITSTASNYNAVLNAAGNKISNFTYTSWQYLLRNWLAANYIKAGTGPFGYMGDISLTPTIFQDDPGNYRISLYPGEGIYLDASAWPNPADPILFADLSGGTVTESGIYPPNNLLCYNVNTDTKGNYSQAIVTLNTSSKSMAGFQQTVQKNFSGASSRSVSEPGPLAHGPHAIGAGDMLRINGHMEDSGAVISKIRSGKRVYE